MLYYFILLLPRFVCIFCRLVGAIRFVFHFSVGRDFNSALETSARDLRVRRRGRPPGERPLSVIGRTARD